ncbi:MAG: tryptophan--tRNA ligase [Clostridiales bacterium]|nr:tryptophan--tRNA ligase [Clostridiales bacterium]
MEDKKTIFSGIQPSGCVTIGNYLGALRSWKELQNDYNCYFCVVDLHAITVKQTPQELRKRCVELYAQYIACGLDPEKNVMFFQSHVPAHSELSWLLTCNTYMGEMSRMTQFKEKSKKAGANVGLGLLSYPVLMAADILLYNTDLVPVGADQKQHLELARDLAIRFNNAYSPTFTVPEPYIQKNGARIMSLQDPLSKMSKSSENVNAFVSILNEPDVVMKKFARAVTDSDNQIRHDIVNKPGITNLIEIYSACTGKNIEQIEKDFEFKGYGDFKKAVGEAVVETIKPIQDNFKHIMQDKAYMEKCFTIGAEKASYTANKTLAKVQRKMGLASKKL